MSIVDQAVENLDDHEVEVDKPEKVEVHSQVNSESEALSNLGIQQGLEAATYNSLNDRIDLYGPLAASKVIHKLDEEEKDQVLESLKRNKGSFQSELRNIETGESKSPTDTAKLGRIQYLSAVKDEEVDDELQEKLRNSLDQELLYSTEHELVHASHYQEVLDTDVDPLQDSFQRYMRDVKTLNNELNKVQKRKMNEGIAKEKDTRMAAAMNFVDEDRLQNIVALAGEEHKKWSRKEERKLQNYTDRKEEAVSEIKDPLDIIPEMAFDQIKGQVTSEYGPSIGPDDGESEKSYGSVDQLVEELEEEGDENYEELREAGVSKQELKDKLRELEQIEEEWQNRDRDHLRKQGETLEHLEKAILREAEIQGDFEGYLEQYEDRRETIDNVPTEFTEAFAQFWTAYREGDLEENRDQVYERLDGYDAEDIDDVMDDIFQMYDSAEGDQEERVAEVMSSQTEYFEQNYEVEA